MFGIQKCISMRLIIYCLILFISGAQNVNSLNAFAKPKDYPTNKCFLLGILQGIVGSSLDHCAIQCVLWNKCVGVSYNRQMTACFLIDDHYNDETATVDGTACINLNLTEISLHAHLSVGACAKRSCSDKDECLSKGTRGDDFECVPKECPKALETQNVTIPYGTRLVGATNSLKCRQGYTLFGNSSVTCAKDGKWSSSDFKCYKNCPTPSLTNAVVTLFNPRLAYNTTAEFMCNDEYTLVGYPTIMCLNNGEWSSPEFSCYPNCKMPSLQYAYLVTADLALVFNTSAIFICNDGYTALGVVAVACLSNGEWSEAEFECHPNCQTPSVQNADVVTFNATLAFNTIATMKCREGFYSETSRTTFTITCESHGEWSKGETCLGYCSDPPIKDNTAIQGAAPPYKMDMTVKYTCNGGYYTPYPEDSTIHCLNDGTWTNTDFTCNKYCASLPSISDANLVGTPEAPYTTASTAKYQCKEWYHHTGVFSAAADYHCNGNGKWIGTLNCCLAGFRWDESEGRCCLLGIC